MEELIDKRENIKSQLDDAINIANQAMKVWQEKTKAVTDLQNKLMKINAEITNAKGI